MSRSIIGHPLTHTWLMSGQLSFWAPCGDGCGRNGQTEGPGEGSLGKPHQTPHLQCPASQVLPRYGGHMLVPAHKVQASSLTFRILQLMMMTLLAQRAFARSPAKLFLHWIIGKPMEQYPRHILRACSLADLLLLVLELISFVLQALPPLRYQRTLAFRQSYPETCQGRNGEHLLNSIASCTEPSFFQNSLRRFA